LLKFTEKLLLNPIHFIVTEKDFMKKNIAFTVGLACLAWVFFEGYQGTLWTNIFQGTMANVSIGAPSSNLVKSGPVTFEVTYSSGTDTATINLVEGVVTINGANTGCQVTSITGTGYNRVITIHSCTGTGSVSLSLAAGTAQSITGDKALSAGPSQSYQVDNTGPTAPTSVNLGSVKI
jgi:hypothetical protein